MLKFNVEGLKVYQNQPLELAYLLGNFKNPEQPEGPQN